MLCQFRPFFRPFFSLLFVHFIPLLFLFSALFAANPSEDLVEFLFQHQQICGSPFSDAQWVPVLDLCEIKCDEEREICVENDEMKQQCSKLPDACVRSWISNKSANLRSSSVVVFTRPPPQKQSQTNGSGKGANADQQQQQKNNGRNRDGTEKRNASERRRSPAQMSAKRATMTSTVTVPRTTTAKRRTEEKPKKAMARQETTEGKAKKGAKGSGKERWTLVPVKRKEEGKKQVGTGSRRGPHILQSVIELLREE
ncbi:hypothetical protein niasHS_017463 [Heterodera schachtii]|uniref:Uncharacterized protein n=2 Tax=Heterodera TaxID=34509 RepID=A0ABD2HXL5_HETSC